MTAQPVGTNRPLNRQLLLSHLSVALIGLAMLGIALIATYDLRARVISLANASGPMAQASFQLLTGIRHSLASLRGWATLGDPRFLAGWRDAWQDEIQPALDQLKQCPRLHDMDCIPELLRELQALLADLRESQWWIQDIVRAPGNEPARVMYALEAEPSAAALHSLLAALFREEKELESGPERKALLGQLAEIQDAFSAAHLLLREILGANGPKYEARFQESLESVRSKVAMLGETALLTPDQRQHIHLLRDELRTFADFAREVIRLRQSSGWNIALHTMTQETDPLADRAIALATAMSVHARTRLDQEILAAQTASAITVWSLALMILVMLVVAYALSQKYARTIALPITSLAEATRQLALGDGPHADIPLGDSDEISELTRSFIAMRTSMRQGQETLRQTNLSLEQRVADRTIELAAANNALVQEIEVRNQTEQALRDSEARLLAMTKAIPDLVFVVDEDGRHREILASRKDVVAIGPLRGKLLSEIYPPDKAAYFLDIIHRALATQRIQVAEYELQTASGSRWFESRTAPVDIKFDAKAAVIVVAHDITRRKQAEAQLRQAQKMQAIGQLTGGIAHDFNNLLAVIMGNLELLHEQLTAQPRLHELAQQALRAVDRGANLTRRLLVFARRQPLLAQPTDLNRLVLGMLDLMRRTLGATIQIDTKLAADLQPTLVDPSQLESSLLNLVINARDAMPQGGRLTLETAKTLIAEDESVQAEVRPGPYIMLAVSDTGVGMAPEALERAFEPFFTTKESGKGSGLGLSMVYGLVKQSNGHIMIDSEPGRGTTVRLYLPEIATPAQAVTEPQPHEVSIQGRGETILVVEDDAEVRQFAVNAVRGLGYDPLPAADAETALRILEATPRLALLFTDIVMPGGMDGVQLAAEAQRRHPGLPVLFTSGYTEHALIGDGHLAEGVEVLTKPYRKAELGRKLRRLLNHRETG